MARHGSGATNITGNTIAAESDASGNDLQAVVRGQPGTSATATPITGQSLEAGGVEDLGWLSSIRKAITDRLSALGRQTTANSTSVTLSSDHAAVPISGTVALSGGGVTQYAEDAASAGGEQLTLAGTVRQDTPAGSTSADGDYQPLKTDSLGRLWTHIAASDVALGAITRGVMTATSPTFTSGVSAAIDTNGYVSLGAVIGTLHASTASLAYQGSHDNATFKDLYGESGVRLTTAVGSDRAAMLPTDLAAFRYVKLVALTSAAATNTSQTGTPISVGGKG